MDTSLLHSVLSSSGLTARKQDGKVLLYNTAPQWLSRGILVANLEDALRLSSAYLRYLQTVGIVSINDFAQDNQSTLVDFHDVENRVDEASAYYINRVAMSMESRINLLIAAKELESRSLVDSVLSRREKTLSSAAEDIASKRYLKLKKAASYHTNGFSYPVDGSNPARDKR